MAKFIALLRAVNVGGTGKLPMADLREICVDAGFEQVRTYIASGNVIFRSKLGPKKVKKELEERLQIYAGKPVQVLIRSDAELKNILANNPFAKEQPSQVLVTFLDQPPPQDILDKVSGVKQEEIKLGAREIYIHYPGGMGTSKLKVPAAKIGTARNINTIRKLANLVTDL